MNSNWQKHYESQKREIVNPYEIDWGKYDLVICLENALPKKILKKYSDVTWATMLEHYKMDSYSKYKKKLPEGYDLFFNQRFGPTPFNIFKKKHVIDWPYSFNYPLDLEKNFGVLKKINIAVIETHSLDSDLERVFLFHKYDIKTTNEGRNINQHLKLLAVAKYLVLPILNSERMLWGNITLEASALSCLLIGNKKFLWNPHLVLNECHITNHRQLEKLLILLKDELYYNELLEKQNKLLIYYGFNRPLKQLYKFLK
jgi:hypothetical protein